MVDYLIEKVFEEYQKNLKYLIESHDLKIEKLNDKVEVLRLAQLNTNWKIVLLSCASGIGGGTVANKILDIILK